MTAWKNRSWEEKTLLSPNFCALLLWHAAGGYSTVGGDRLRFDLSFLVLPFVLHRDTREALPKAVTTSLPVWLDENPLWRARIADRARMLVPFTKEGLMFGGLHGLLDLGGGTVGQKPDWKKKIAAELRQSSDEVRGCAKRAEFVGKWFAKGGSAGTVMATVGVMP
jgi:hypothetical protein